MNKKTRQKLKTSSAHSVQNKTTKNGVRIVHVHTRGPEVMLMISKETVTEKSAMIEDHGKCQIF